jgi:hypothetical protein
LRVQLSTTARLTSAPAFRKPTGRSEAPPVNRKPGRKHAPFAALPLHSQAFAPYPDMARRR